MWRRGLYASKIVVVKFVCQTWRILIGDGDDDRNIQSAVGVIIAPYPSESGQYI